MKQALQEANDCHTPYLPDIRYHTAICYCRL